MTKGNKNKPKPAFAKSNGEPKKVFVGLSGGVDSSVSLALLKKAGYDVTGVFIKVWHPDWLPCDWKEERRDAMRVAAALDIPFLTFDLQKEYKEGVVDYMLREYKNGRTPNPDVMCNKEIKFGGFLNKAIEMGADFIATGHYARITPPSGHPSYKQEGRRKLVEGVDKSKDQSYFLWNLGQKELEHVLFPVGHLEKTEVRKLAKRFGLPTAEKKDSQGICFIGKVDMKEFLSHYIDSVPGIVLNELGKAIGNHDGAVFYTIGQRHGFSITEKTSNDDPYYVISKDILKNTITVSNKKNGQRPIGAVGVRLSDVNWVDVKPNDGKEYSCRLRYRQEKQKCKIETPPRLADSAPLLGKGGEAEVFFTFPQGDVSPGQSLVIYDGEMCLGGGIINEVIY